MSSVTYEELLEHNPLIGRFLSRERYDFAVASNERTTKSLGKQWDRNLRKNLRKLYRKHGMLMDNCGGFGANKAVVGIGAGPSFNRNKEVLKRLCMYNARFPFSRQPFIFIASNHQFRPCLEMGIIPHFVLLVDASDSGPIIDQLCNIPKRGEHVPLICSLHSSPKLLKKWDRQGKIIQFYMPIGPENRGVFKEITGKTYPKEHQIMQGGNVLNVAWRCSIALGSNVFMCVGNDLSYEISDDEESRRASYYADGDYSTNLASKRDEAGRQFRWMGFDIADNLITNRPQLNFKEMATVQSLYSYKTWMETQAAIQAKAPVSWHYYNCSESGILGVVAKSEAKEDLDSLSVKDNWELMDELLPNHWHTQKLEDAAMRFLAAREACQTPTAINDIVITPDAGALQPRTVGASGIVHPG